VNHHYNFITKKLRYFFFFDRSYIIFFHLPSP
jgi:hypothetical protein